MRRWISAILGLAAGLTAHAADQTLFLNGSTERVIVDHDSGLNPAAGITIEIWVRPSSLTGCQTLVGKDFTDGYWLGLCDGIIRYYTNGTVTRVDGSRAITIGQWWHIAVAFDGTERRYYINGELDASFNTPRDLPANDAPLGIGGQGASDSFPDGVFSFSGYLSEVRLWSYARSEAQIRSTLYVQETRSLPGLIGVWALEGGANDRFGRFSSLLAPGASFSGINSPPVPHDPLHFGFTDFISVDGRCDESSYSSSTSVPIWYLPADLGPGQHNPLEILAGGDANHVYVCIPNREVFGDPIYSVEIDADNNAGPLQGSDYRFRLWPDNDGLTTLTGSTSPPPFNAPSWNPAVSPAGLEAAVTPGGEFVTDIEFRIPRSIVTSADGRFRMRVGHNYLIGSGPDTATAAWPPESSDTVPGQWQEVVIDPTPISTVDNENPMAYVLPAFATGPAEPVTFVAEATDDTDIELLEIVVDGNVVASEGYEGSDNLAVELRHEEVFSAGHYRYFARARDRDDNTTESRIRSFFVRVDGETPSISIGVSPDSPALGQTLQISATAEDPAGIESIQIIDVLGVLSPSFRRCDYSGGGTVETCVWTVSPDVRIGLLLIRASATDAEDLMGHTLGDLPIVIGGNGVDSDDDGLTDLAEQSLCTRPNDPDTDQDGLSDGWEVNGIRFANGELEPLYQYGVNPCFKNMLLQLDYEAGSIVSSSRLSRLLNRYRENGISIYVETNRRPKPTAYPQSHLSAGSHAVHQTVDGQFYFDPKRNWAFVYGYQRSAVGSSGAGNRFFDIDLLSGSQGFCGGGDLDGGRCNGDFDCPGLGGSCIAGCTAGPNEGQACDERLDCPNGDGTFAQCAAPCDPGTPGSCTTRTDSDLGYRLFHEFSHVAGLGHGGHTGTRTATVDGGFVQLDSRWNTRNYKPNYFSAMNYLYNSSVLCMAPVPDEIPEGYLPKFTGQLNLNSEITEALDETSLPESPTSSLASAIGSRNCSFSGAGSFPVIVYSCADGGMTYDRVVSDGTRTVARKLKDGDWDYDPPEHAPGIDWNCDGLIDSIVGQDINGDGSLTELQALNDYDVIPNPRDCQRVYAYNCKAPEKSCYPWPDAYTSAIPALATGIEPIDCRAWFLSVRFTQFGPECHNGEDSDFGDQLCPVIFDRDTPVAANAAIPHLNGFDGWAGVPDATTDSELDPVVPLPGLEFCDLEDNDGDGEVDEGCADDDADEIPNDIDNCQTFPNPLQVDFDNDGLGDDCQFPEVQDLTISHNGGTVSLSWANNGVPGAGYAIYRYRSDDLNPVYLGDQYPSTQTTSYEESVAGGLYNYVVRAVNLNGQETGEMMTTVEINLTELLFADGFED